MRMRARKTWRHFKYWLLKKMFSEEERKVLFNIRMSFYEYQTKGEME